jgi:leader peptidase (prepilin peptidase)/N-methyltransferase
MNWTDMLTYKPFHGLVSLCVFVWGACIGSFLNVCIYRIPRELSIVRPRSACPGCGFAIPWYLNMPIISYLVLRGRCRSCKTRISPRYVLVEALTGVLFLLVWLKFSPFGVPPLGLAPADNGWMIPVYWLVVAGLILGTFVDFEHLIIPDRVTLGGIAAGLVLSMMVPSLHGDSTLMRGLMHSAIGAWAGWCLLWAVAVIGEWLFKKEAMGFGDVKLLSAIGAFFGWQAVLFNVIVSSLAGSLVGVTLVIFGQRSMQSRIPYGPYIALAALIWMFWGHSLWAWYVRMILFRDAATPL